MLRLHGWGGADMFNLFDPSGHKLTSTEEHHPIVPRSQKSAIVMGANKVIPFSSFHRYQREDSVWANALIPEIADYGNHAMAKGPEILPPFVRVNCETDEIIPLEPLRLPQLSKTSGGIWRQLVRSIER